MADCFSLPNAAELVKQLRLAADKWERAHPITPTFELVVHAALRYSADAIEQFGKDIDVLAKENAKLKAERDAAVAEIVKMCPNCKHASCGWFSKECIDCYHKENWEWRGVQKEEEQ